MSKQGTAGMQKYITLTIHQKLEIIRRHESGKSQRAVMASYNIGSSTIYDIKMQKDKLISCMASSKSMKDFSKQKTLKQPNIETA
jgi:transposase